MSLPARFRLDDLRRFAIRLLEARGVSPAHALGVIRYLLWFDEAGAGRFGFATLPDWLDRLARGDFDGQSDGRVGFERAGTTLLDAARALPPIVLQRAANLAAEKARDLGMGVVRITNLASPGPSAPISADLALGPLVGTILGPEPSWSMALPSPAGLPVVIDSTLAGDSGQPPPAWLPLVASGLGGGPGGWLVVASAVPAFEPLTTFHERIGLNLPRNGSPGLIRPEMWEASRTQVYEAGIEVNKAAWKRLNEAAQALGVEVPRRK